MRATLSAARDRWFPGLTARATWITVLGAFMLILYYHHGLIDRAPDWFVGGAPAWTGLEHKPKFHRHLWGHLSAAVMLMGVPLLYAWAFEGLRPHDLGFRLRGTRREFGVVLGLWLALLPVLWFVSRTEAFSRFYPRLPAASRDPQLFVLYESVYLLKWTAWEFFFRGFLLFGLARDLRGAAVLVSTVPFALMHIGKPELEMLGAVPAGFVLCALAWSSRSIWPGVLLHWGVAVTMDLLGSDWWR